VQAPWLSILTYHRFPAPGGVERFDEGVVDVTVDQLDRHIACLVKYFNPVGVDELCAFARGGRLPPRPVAVTFDDGYLDNHAQALPILRRHGCKAIFFVTTSMISERRVYWWDRVAYLLKATERSVVELDYPRSIRLELGAERGAAIAQLLRLLKVYRALDFERLLESLSKATGVPWSREREREFADTLIMSWDHVRELKRAGMDVESHTRTHRVLQTLSADQLRLELEGSRRDLERELGKPARAVAYPVGNPLHPRSPIRAALLRAGYELGFSNGTGPTPLWRRPDRFDICRQTVGRSICEPYLLSILAIPPLAPRHPWHLTNV
jgi:peptidoglycan/xylan/chitin deacetylase (PgdA/CDA1 family)